MVDHLAGHAAVDADVLAGDEARLVRAEEQHHVGDVQRVAHPPGGVLGGVRTLIYGVVGVDPAGGDGVHPHPARQTHRQRMGQGGDTALGCGVAFGLGLAHPVPGRGDVHDGRTVRKMGREQLGQVKGCGNAHPQSIVEFLIAAFVDALHQGQSVVDEVIHMAVLGNHRLGELLQCGRIGNVSHETVGFQQVDNAYLRTGLAEFPGDGLADALCTAGDHNHLVFTGPIGPIGPVAPTAPAGPIGPIGPVAPTAPAGPIGPIGPVAPTAPAGPIGPIAPVAPGAPAGPIGPVAPTAPAGPIGPIGPVTPGAPAGPIGPIGPVAPGAPSNPGNPCGPLGPSGPGHP